MHCYTIISLDYCCTIMNTMPSVWSLLFIKWVAVIEAFSFATELHYMVSESHTIESFRLLSIAQTSKQ